MNPFIEKKKEQAKARKEQLMGLVKKRPLSVTDVVEHFNVSVATARNDLNALKKSKLVGGYRSSEEGQKGIMLYALPEAVPPGKRRKRRTATRKRKAGTRARRGRPVRRRRRVTAAVSNGGALQTVLNVLLDRLTQLEVKVESLSRSKR